MKARFKSGCWSCDEAKLLLVFHPLKNDPRPDIPEDGVELDQLTTSAELLDMILQTQRKGRWSERGEMARNNYGKRLCDDYQISEFIDVVDMPCRHYLKTSIQGAFSPFGTECKIDWDKLTSERKASE